ncbi:ATP-binding cassette subfamily B protein [Streptosporangium becharense]|uniref:ATP-binding cassette subfamily B protein n=1 Tax=Streptosporangium becharense TaxID=1816182 RepID=A0A7W9MJ20_9ACTN|nr:ABC transporter ATP-binding protein [Streptosporangium becharense]MBB2911557.1 ATP-binding cassette subfamily B protein [Streptosporangium becharense]MBB5822625.1 ATP-binding cassette subfamily B protein [Streptosporangium becharense]
MRAADRLVTEAVRRGGAWPAVLAVASVLGAAAELALPFALGRAVDELVAGGPGATVWPLICATVVTLAVACDALGVWASGASGARSSAWLRERVVRHILGVGPAITRRFPEGELVIRTTLNTEEIGRAPEAVVTGAALLIPTAGGVLALTLIDPWLTATLVAGITVIALVLRAFLTASTSIAGGYQEAQGDIAARLVDALAGARTIAAAGTADRERARVLSALPRLRRHAMEMWRANARAGVQAGAVVPLLEVAVLAMGGLRLTSGDLTAGELYAAARYVVLGAGLGSALGHVGRLARARAAAARVAELTAEPSRDHGTRSLPHGPGDLELRGVGAGVLDGIDVFVPGGRAVAVVGRSGSGKSLLAALAGRLVDPERGTVSLDGVPLPELSPSALREAVGYAFERPVLLGGTVGDAIAFGAGASGEAVRAAARAARADTFVRRLPLGYDTPLARAPMSGGERQRLGLARAFAQGRRLLILDDATSSLDTATECQVAAALTGELRDRTRLIVTHRAATAAAADRVIWLDAGRVRAFGSHRDLWSDPGYRAVFQVAAP